MLEAVVDGHVMLELEGNTSGWIAVGYSYDQVMGGDSIDDVIGCLVTGTEETVVAKDTVNLQNLLSNVDDTVSILPQSASVCHASNMFFNELVYSLHSTSCTNLFTVS